MFKAGQQGVTADSKDLLLVESNGLLRYPNPLNFYDKPPLFDVTVDEFEITAIDRLRVLAEIESSLARNRTWEELKTATHNQYMKYVPLHTHKQWDPEEERRKDHLGHYVLRLAFCRSEDLRQRFVKAESVLFRVRYEEIEATDRENFLASRNFNWIAVSQEEKDQFAAELYSMYQFSKFEGTRAAAFKREKFYKVRWTRVPDLVEKRKVFLKGGWAFVPSTEQSSIVFQEYENELEKALETTARLLPRLDEDSRLMPVLDNLSHGFVAGIASEWAGATGPGNAGEIRAEMIDDLAKKHFPMCMRTLHESLQRDNHLKHFGRLQYGLFLKVLGVSVEEAVAFWRKSFSRITDDKFNKEYKYNIRHSYGLEGKRANYPAKNCLQIITGPSEVGCPYRHFSPENLQTGLLSLYSQQGLKAADLPEIMATVKAGHYHVACTRVFEMTHASCGVTKGEGIGGGESVTHPNQYAARSIELAKAKNGEDKMVE